MPDDDGTLYAMDPDEVLLLLRAHVGFGDVVNQQTGKGEQIIFLDMGVRTAKSLDDSTTLMVGMNRGQAEVLHRELGEALTRGE